jgi:hypothetical protein
LSVVNSKYSTHIGCKSTKFALKRGIMNGKKI